MPVYEMYYKNWLTQLWKLKKLKNPTLCEQKNRKVGGIIQFDFEDLRFKGVGKVSTGL